MKLHRICLVIALGLLASPSLAQMSPQRTTGGQINLIRPRNRGVQPRCTTVRTMPNMPATTTCERPQAAGGGAASQPGSTTQPAPGSSSATPSGKATPTP